MARDTQPNETKQKNTKINESAQRKSGLAKSSARRRAENPAKVQKMERNKKMLSTRDIQVISIITYLMIGMGKMEMEMENSSGKFNCTNRLQVYDVQVHYTH